METVFLQQLIDDAKGFVVTKKIPPIVGISKEEKDYLLENILNKKYIRESYLDLSAAIIKLIRTRHIDILWSYQKVAGQPIEIIGFRTDSQLINFAQYALIPISQRIEQFSLETKRLMAIESTLTRAELLVKNSYYSKLETDFLLAIIQKKDSQPLLQQMNLFKTTQSNLIDLSLLFNIREELNHHLTKIKANS